MQYTFSRIVAGPFLHTIWRPKVTGAGHVPVTGGAILAANHLSVVDSVFLPLMLDRPVTFSAKAEYFTASGPAARLWAWYLKATNQLRMDRDGPRAAQDTLEAALALLRAGNLFGIYPEGTRSPDGRLYRGRPGVGWLALKSGLPVLPVGIHGTRRVLPPGHVLPRPGRIEVRIGAPLSFSADVLGAPPGQARRLIAEQVMTAIRELSGQEYVHMYASDRKAELAAADGAAKRRRSLRPGALRAEAEQFHRVPHVGEARLGGHLLGPPLHRPALHLHAAPAAAAGQVVVVHARLALPVEDLAVGVADRVDAALLAERLQVPVDGGEPDVLALAPQFRVDLLGAAEAGQALQRGGQCLRLPGPADPGAPRGPDPHVLLGLRHRHNRTLQPEPPFRPTSTLRANPGPRAATPVLQATLGIIIITNNGETARGAERERYRKRRTRPWARQRARHRQGNETDGSGGMRGGLRARAVVAPLVLALAAGLVSACAPSLAAISAGSGGKIVAVGAENEYADVVQQVGGKYVQVSAIMSNPNTDPHTFEASASVGRLVNAARLVVQNGVGYDTFMNTIENAVPDSSRQVIVVQKLLGLPDSTPNPHLWYQPGTMAKVAAAIAAGLAALQPGHAAYFKANAAAFTGSLKTWTDAIAAFRQQYPGTPVATTEPVADYLLQALGADNRTPWAFQADIMNGTDPSAQDVAVERSLFTRHQVRAFLYNQQVTDSLTESFISLARANGIPVVGVYETMPEPGYHYQSWMLAEVQDLRQAIADHVSSEHL